MEEITERIYKTLLLKEDGTYLGWEPTLNESGGVGEGMQWIEWNKPLPDDIDSVEYTIDSLNEWYNNLEVV